MVCSICKCEGHNKRKCPSINVVKEIRKPEMVKNLEPQVNRKNIEEQNR